MTALEKLNKMAADIHAEATRLQAQYPKMADGIAFMRKHGARTIAEGFRAEATARIINQE